MRAHKGWGLLMGSILLALVVGFSSHLTTSRTQPATSAFTPAPAGDLSLITEPDDGLEPLLQQMNGAKQSINLVMYELEDPQIEQALVTAANRGVNVRVLLNQGYYGAVSTANQAAYAFLTAHHLAVHWTPNYFALTHEKMLEVDNQLADIMTFNFTPQYYASSRDFGITDRDPTDVQAITATFNADWDLHKITASSGDDLLWSPGSETATLQLIASAKQSLDIYNEEMADRKVETALEAAAQRGVDVEITMTYASDWKTAFQNLSNTGVHIRTYTPTASRYIHAKMIMVDNHEAFVGSENFSTGSLDKNRELGLLLSNPSIISSLEQTFTSDYQAATPY